jgi:hypothetical protein
LVMIGGGCGPVGPGTRMAHCRSLGYPRDDKKGRAVARKGRLLDERAVAEPRHLSNLIWTGLKFSRPCGTDLGNGVHTDAPCEASERCLPENSRIPQIWIYPHAVKLRSGNPAEEKLIWTSRGQINPYRLSPKHLGSKKPSQG